LAKVSRKSSTVRRFSDALKLLIERGEYPHHLAVETLVRALAKAKPKDWKADFKGHRVPDLWKRLSGGGEPQLFVDPHYEENWIEARDAHGSYIAYNIRVADKVVLPLLPARAPGQQNKRQKRIGRPPDVEREKIATLARDYITAHGLPRSANLLIEKVRDLCPPAKVTAPSDTVMKEIVGPVHKHAKRNALEARLLSLRRSGR